MKRNLLFALLAVLAHAGARAEPLFGLDDETGMKGVRSLEESEIENSLDRANVPGVLVFPSPDGRFAFNRPTVEQAERVGFDGVSNHLVDLQTNKSIMEIGNSNGGDFQNRNHGGMRVLWRPDSRAAIFIAEHKWAPSTFCIIVIGDDNKPRQIAVDALLLREMRSQLLKKWPVIHESLKLGDSERYDGENGPWSVEEIHFGCSFAKGGKTAKVKGTMSTNGKGLDGSVSAEIVAEGIVTLETGKAAFARSRVLSAGLMVYDEESGENVLRPLVRFDK